MKKVLSLSVLLVTLGAEVVHAVPKGRREIFAPSSQPASSQSAAPSAPAKGGQSATLTTASAAAQYCTMHDIVAAAQALGGDATKSTSNGKAVAQSFISNGSATAPSSNKSNKLGRLGK